MASSWSRPFGSLISRLPPICFKGRAPAKYVGERQLYRFEPQVLEPILHMEVRTPGDYAGTVIGDLMSRRGLLLGQEDRGECLIFTAEVPLAELFGYRKLLDACTAGKGIATAVFARYSPAPPWFDPTEPAAMAMRA